MGIDFHDMPQMGFSNFNHGLALPLSSLMRVPNPPAKQYSFHSN
jgi:hypothetical protein